MNAQNLTTFFCFAIALGLAALAQPLQQKDPAPRGPKAERFGSDRTGTDRERQGFRGGPERHEGRDGRGFRRPPGSKWDMKRALDFIEERDPETAARLRGIEDPEEQRTAFRDYLNRKRPDHRGSPFAFRKPSPELMKIGHEIQNAVTAYYKDPNPEGAAKLRALLERHFDQRCGDDQRHIERLEKDLDGMRSRLVEQRSKRKEQVDAMFKKMTERKGQSESP